ncbi:autotransporter outer membrane beta-barrel domain-containing protein [Stenotrophomonas maltophilia]|uniref:autotransporter family protein n=1 Tax=Stenotrophomonas maltophilia TaxID=40324 RepID=UPI0021CA4720|nr:autotransporter outer membrane beta-barrel domain-containing protein [Stenotrophomonas maltophilia]MCU1091121.1 autotransporter outer membrane beta-barrel domain-containing protein [Stenotrophomonas maltophilia]
MYTMKSASRALPAQVAPLALALAACVGVPLTGHAQSVSVPAGTTLTVDPGSPYEGRDFSVRGTLNLNGVSVGRVDAREGPGAVVNASDTVFTSNERFGFSFTNAEGNITRSTIVNEDANGVGLALAGLISASPQPLSRVQISDSSVSAGDVGGQVAAGGTVIARGTSFSGGTGIRMIAGSFELTEGSRAIGSDIGLRLDYSTAGQPSYADPDDWYVLVDGSHVEGTSGPAVKVGQTFSRLSELSRLTVQNGATLIGGNGNLVEVDPDLALDFTARTSTLNGNFVIADTASTTLRFLDGLVLTGQITGPAEVIVDQGGRWTLSGDSSTGNLTLGADSHILLGAEGQAAYAQLTVNGDYTGNGGTLHFNTVLAGDDAASSRLHVTGATSGTSNVTVNNIAGAGAQTVDGILLVQVDGTSDGSFALQGRAVGGMYEYFLHKGSATTANGNWYLTSAYTGNPCDINPSLPECDPEDPVIPPPKPEPVLRPEPGAYLANQIAAEQMFQVRRHDRGEPGFDRARPGTWVRAGRDQIQASIAGQVDARTHLNVLQLGSDLWRWSDGRGQVGVMLGTGDATTRAVSMLSGYGTRGRVKGKSAGVYLGWVQDAQNSGGLYVDGWVQAARFDNDVQGEGIAAETYDADVRSASLELGYAWAIRTREASTLYLQPQAQLTWTDYDSDSLVEDNGTRVEDGRSIGLNSRLGVRLFGQSTLRGNRVQPFLAVNWLRGQRDPSMRFNEELLSAKTPDSRYEMQAGAQLQLGQRWSAWGDLRVQRGDSGYRNHGAQVGLRAAW